VAPNFRRPAKMLTGDVEVVLTIRFSTTPGTTPEQAARMIANTAINIPLGLTPHIKQVDVNVVDAGEEAKQRMHIVGAEK
jgi:hypothetical protein